MSPSTTTPSSLKTVLLKRYGVDQESSHSTSTTTIKKSDCIPKIDQKRLQAAKAKKEAAEKEKARLDAQRKERQERLKKQKIAGQMRVADVMTEIQDWRAQRRLAMLNEGSAAPKELPREMEMPKKRQTSKKTFSRR